MGTKESHLSKGNKEKMKNVEYHFIIEKIGRAHKEKDNKSGNNRPIIAKFTDWNISEEVKSCFMTAAKNGNDQIPIIVFQMYKPALTMRCNEAMMKRKDQRIQTYVKHPTILMVKRPGETRYTTYGEF